MLDLTRVYRAVFSTAIAAALGFGATQLAAAPRSASTCPFDLGTGWVGACSTNAACSQTCLTYYPENGGVGHCTNGCCLCAT